MCSFKSAMIHGRSHGDGYYFDVVVYNGLLLLNMNVVEILLSMNVVEILLNMNIVVIEQGGGKHGVALYQYHGSGMIIVRGSGFR